MKNTRSPPGLKQRTNIKLLATSVGKNVRVYAQTTKMRNTYTYTSLDGSKYILACRNTPEIHLLPQIRERFGEIAHLSLSLSLSLSFSLSSPSLSLRCASFTRTPGVKTLNPSLEIIHWRTAGESRETTLGASLLEAKISRRLFFFSFALLSLLRSPKSRSVSKNS